MEGRDGKWGGHHITRGPGWAALSCQFLLDLNKQINKPPQCFLGLPLPSLVFAVPKFVKLWISLK